MNFPKRTSISSTQIPFLRFCFYFLSGVGCSKSYHKGWLASILDLFLVQTGSIRKWPNFAVFWAFRGVFSFLRPFWLIFCELGLPNAALVLFLTRHLGWRCSLPFLIKVSIFHIIALCCHFYILYTQFHQICLFRIANCINFYENLHFWN